MPPTRRGPGRPGCAKAEDWARGSGLEHSSEAHVTPADHDARPWKTSTDHQSREAARCRSARTLVPYPSQTRRRGEAGRRPHGRRSHQVPSPSTVLIAAISTRQPATIAWSRSSWVAIPPMPSSWTSTRLAPSACSSRQGWFPGSATRGRWAELQPWSPARSSGRRPGRTSDRRAARGVRPDRATIGRAPISGSRCTPVVCGRGGRPIG